CQLVTIAGEVAPGTTGYATGSKIMLNAGNPRHSGLGNARQYTRAFGHFRQMAEQTEAGDISHRLHAVQLREARTDTVELAHQIAGHADIFLTQLFLFFSSGENADTQRLGQI